MLPLDLHVSLQFVSLSLPCGIDFLPFTGRLLKKTSCSFAPPALRPRDASLASCHCTLFLLLLTTSFRWESGCKDMVLLPYRPNISGNIFWTFFFIFRQNVVPQAFGREKIFFVPRRHFPQGRRKRQGEAATSRDCLPLRMTCAVVRRAGAPRRVCTGMSWPCP